MPFTRRFLALCAVAGVLWILGSAWVGFAWLGGLWILAMVGLLAYDAQSIPRREQLRVRRFVASDLSVAADNTMEIELLSSADEPVRVEVRDWLPQSIIASESRLEAQLLPFVPLVWRHVLRPVRRGSYTLGPIFVKLTGALGLAEARFAFSDEHPIEVIPDLLATQRYDLRLRRGLVRLQGNRRMRLAGRGSEFESLRTYTPDDDPRHIDWRASARLNKVLSRVYQPETKQRLVVCVDLGRLMLGRDGDLAKIDQVLNSAMLLGHAAIRAGDALGLIAFSDRLQARLPVSASPGQPRQLLRAIAPLEADAVETDFRLLHRELAIVERKRALVVVYTDLIDETQVDEVIQMLRLIGRRHRVLVVAVRDPELFSLVRMSPTNTRSAFASGAAAHLLSHRKAALVRLQRAGLLTVDVDSSELSMAVVERYLRLREAKSF